MLKAILATAAVLSIGLSAIANDGQLSPETIAQIRALDIKPFDREKLDRILEDHKRNRGEMYFANPYPKVGINIMHQQIIDPTFMGSTYMESGDANKDRMHAAIKGKPQMIDLLVESLEALKTSPDFEGNVEDIDKEIKALQAQK